ncbi:hypothetical protein [Candidatus Protochlamydia sp. W-9]|nr:hypothetical protein [Candidatus Protochlamydia sp. W-9]
MKRRRDANLAQAVRISEKLPLSPEYIDIYTDFSSEQQKHLPQIQKLSIS